MKDNELIELAARAVGPKVVRKARLLEMAEAWRAKHALKIEG